MSEALNRLVLGAVMGLMVIETVVVASAVFARYVLNSPFSWSEELARLLVVWIVFLGASCAYAGGDLVRITLFGDIAGPAVSKAILVLTDILILGFSAVCFWYALRLGRMTALQTMPSLQIPLLWATAAIPISSVIIGFHALRFLWAGHPPERQLVPD